MKRAKSDFEEVAPALNTAEPEAAFVDLSSPERRTRHSIKMERVEPAPDTAATRVEAQIPKAEPVLKLQEPSPLHPSNSSTLPSSVTSIAEAPTRTSLFSGTDNSSWRDRGLQRGASDDSSDSPSPPPAALDGKDEYWICSGPKCQRTSKDSLLAVSS